MPISNLTGTTWTINSTTCTAGYGKFYIDFLLKDGEFNPYDMFCIGWRIGSGSEYPTANMVGISVAPEHLSVNDEITITGGTDATNATLIAWFEANATLIPSTAQLTVDMSTLTGWDALSSGAHSVQIVAKATGYADSDPSTAVSFTKAASGYDVTLSFAENIYADYASEESELLIKLNGTPASDDDYDYRMLVPWAGSEGCWDTPEGGSWGVPETFVIHNCNSLSYWFHRPYSYRTPVNILVDDILMNPYDSYTEALTKTFQAAGSMTITYDYDE